MVSPLLPVLVLAVVAVGLALLAGVGLVVLEAELAQPLSRKELPKAAVP